MVRGPIRGWSDDPDEIDKAREEQEDYLFDGLSQYILVCYDRAKTHRETHGIDEQITMCLRAYKSAYSSEEKAKFDGIAVYRGLTGMLCRTAESWLEDAYAMVEDKPWTLDPTPIPTLPKVMRQALEGAIRDRLNQMLSATGLSVSDQQRYDIVRALKQEAETMAQEDASKALVGMDKKIQDQLIEGGWRDEFSKFRHDVMIYPTAVLKQGVFRKVKKAIWNGDDMEVVDEVVRVVERVAAADCYPSPDSTTAQDGEYFIERMRMSRSSLLKCIDLPYFFREALRLVLYDFPQGTTEHDGTNNRMAWLEAVDPDDKNIYYVYDFHGRVAGEDILAFYDAEDDADIAKRDDGVVETPIGDIDPFGTYEVNAWLCGGKVIRLLMSPDPLEQRPYLSSSYCKVPGSFWGMSIPVLLESLQSELNTAARSRAFNMALASGPLVEIDVDRLPSDDKPDHLEPWRIYYTTGAAGSGSAPAVRFNQANSNSAELTAVMEETWLKGHDIVGLPPYTYGQNQGAARTLGAFSMQYNSATKGIKRVIGNIDRDVIEPLIAAYYYFNMFNDEDPGIKADAQIIARGTVGLIRKEAEQQQPLEILGQLGPIMEKYPQAVDFLIRDFFVQRGYDPERLGIVPNSTALALGPQAGQPGSTDPAGSAQLPGVPVDGRSGGAAAVMNQLPL